MEAQTKINQTLSLRTRDGSIDFASKSRFFLLREDHNPATLGKIAWTGVYPVGQHPFASSG